MRSMCYRYVQAHHWTTEASVEHPGAVRQLAIEFARAGADITQTYTFYSDDEKLKARLGPTGPTVIICSLVCTTNYKIRFFSVDKLIKLRAILQKKFLAKNPL